MSALQFIRETQTAAEAALYFRPKTRRTYRKAVVRELRRAVRADVRDFPVVPYRAPIERACNAAAAVANNRRNAAELRTLRFRHGYRQQSAANRRRLSVAYAAICLNAVEHRETVPHILGGTNFATMFPEIIAAVYRA